MLELVLVTTEAAIARPIAIVGAVLKDLQRVLENSDPESAHSLSKPGAARKSIVDIDLRLQSISSSLRKCRSIFCLQLVRFEFEPRAGSLGKRLAYGPKRHIRRKQVGAQRDRRFHADRYKQNVGDEVSSQDEPFCRATAVAI